MKKYIVSVLILALTRNFYSDNVYRYAQPEKYKGDQHEPLNFFPVYRPEGEFTILPSTWHDTGISIWGTVPLGTKGASMRYEAQVLAGLDAMRFSRDKFIHNGAHSAFEFKVANTKIATAHGAAPADPNDVDAPSFPSLHPACLWRRPVYLLRGEFYFGRNACLCLKNYYLYRL